METTAPEHPALETVLRDLAAEMAARTDRGAVATYIPQLGKVDPAKFGIAVALEDGRVIVAGDADEPFSIQSVSKVFTLTLALGKVGDALWKRVGREPSGNPFNSIVQLEQERGIPRNPFINAGAIVVSDVLLAGHEPREAIGEILRFIQFLADDETDLHRPRRGGVRTRHRVPQFRARQLYEIVRQSRSRRGTVARRLFPPLRHRHELPATGACRAVPRASTGAIRWRDTRSSRPAGRGALTR